MDRYEVPTSSSIHHARLDYHAFLSEVCCYCALIRILTVCCLLLYITTFVSFPALGFNRQETELANSFTLKLQYRM